MKLVSIHLSDIHFKQRSDEAFLYAEPIAKAAVPKIRDADIVVVIVTGDIAYSGTKTQYDVAEEFLSEITSRLEKETDGSVEIALVPGNHDCDFSEDQTVRNMVIKCIHEEGPAIVNDALIELCATVQGNFFEFRRKISPQVSELDKLWARYQYDINGYKISIECLNVAWISQIKERQGALVFPVSKYQKFKEDHSNLRIVAMHHPLNWYSQSTYRDFRKFVREISHIVMTGHEHEKNAGEIVDQESGHSCFVEAGAISPDSEGFTPSFTVLEVDFDAQEYVADIHVFQEGAFVSLENAPRNSYRPLPVKRHIGIEISAEFKAKLDDPGANFSHPSKSELCLSDIYIFPDLQSRSSGEKKFREIVSSGTLRETLSLGKGVIIKGDDSVGKTSLLYQLYTAYYDQGLVPIYLNGATLSPTDKDLDSSFEKAICSQYGDQSKSKILQLEREKVLFLVDDFDAIKTQGKHREKIFSFLSKRSTSLVLTVSAMYDVEEATLRTRESYMAALMEYELLEFGYKLRFDLIHKWASIGGALDRDSRELVLEIDKIEKAITAILGKNLVSSSPIYILTMLQTQEAGRISSDLQTTGFGEYYKMLIIKSLLKSGVKPNELVEYQAFCSALSWCFCEKKTREISSEEFEEVNSRYSENYHKRPHAERLDILKKSKILELKGGYYSFNYPYHYYFFLGKYIGDRVDYDPPVVKVFLHYCEHLYVKDYGNTILFAAYHNPGPKIYEAVSCVLSKLFANRSPFDLQNDTAQLVSLISQAPALSYAESNVIENRRSANEKHDEVDGPSSKKPVTKDDQEDPDLGFVSRLNLLFKTVDILGQILKNQYATIDKQKKIELITASFDGPMRALSDILSFFEENPDVIIQEIEKAILKKNSDIEGEARRKLATEAAFFLITSVCLAFIYKPTLSVTSEHLLPTISEVARLSGSGSYKLIQLATIMEVKGEIDFKLIAQVAQIARGNPYMEYVMKCIGLHYLYRFKTSDQDKQRLCDGLSIPIESQRAIDLRTRDQKKD